MNALIICITLPFLAALLILILSKRLRSDLLTFALGSAFFASIFVIFSVIKHGQILFTKYICAWFSFSFIADGLSAFMASACALVSFLIVLYCRENSDAYGKRFYFWTALLVGNMLGLVFSANLILMLFFWEFASVCSWRLIRLNKDKESVKAASRAFITNLLGFFLLSAGIILIYINYHTLDLNSLRGANLTNLIAFLLFAGIVVRSAIFPLQSWLVEAAAAPTVVVALLSAVLFVKMGLYVFARVFSLTFLESALFINITLYFSVATLIVAAASALVETNIKKILVYSVISQIGYILIEFITQSTTSFKVGLIYLLAHCLAAAGLFLCAGIVEQKAKALNISDPGCSAKNFPKTSLAFLLCAFSVMGLPPFIGFWPKFFSILTLIRSGEIFAGVVAITGVLFTLFYLMRLYNRLFLSSNNDTLKENNNSIMVWVVLALGFLCLVLGVFFQGPFNLVSNLIK
ncbi:MAG: proton-conducting transporter membrane subunit [Candidatus Omnitrophica bacterium]|nr:proton-conducting transporter membrane subunit [Candidatus Omnitrophota bacterium]